MESVLEIDPLAEFFSAIRNPLTKRNYKKDLKRFYDFLHLERDMKIQAKGFTSRAKPDPSWTTYQINQYILSQRQRVERAVKDYIESRKRKERKSQGILP